jgi:hypothetical protein
LQHWYHLKKASHLIRLSAMSEPAYKHTLRVHLCINQETVTHRTFINIYVKNILLWDSSV